MNNFEKWPNILLKSCSVNTARFSKFGHFFNIRHERVKLALKLKFFKTMQYKNMRPKNNA